MALQRVELIMFDKGFYKPASFNELNQGEAEGDEKMQATFTTVESTAQSLDPFILLLDEVGEWLWRKGVKQWTPGTFQKNRKR